MDAHRKWLFAALALSLVAHAYLFWVCPAPATPDVFERLRVSAHLASGGSLLFEDASIAGLTRPYAYPPLSDVVLAAPVALGLDPLASSFALAALLGILSAALFYLVARAWLSPRASFFAAALFSFFPLVAFRFHTYVGESLGLFWFLLALYLFFVRKKPWWAGLALGVLALTHYRSAATLCAVLVAAAVLYLAFSHRERARACAKTLLLGFLVFLPWLALRAPQILSIRQYANPFVDAAVSPVLETAFSPLSLLVLLAFLALFALGLLRGALAGPRARFVPWFALCAGTLFFLALGALGELLPFYSRLVFVEREFTFLAIPAAFFAAYFLEHAGEALGRPRALFAVLFLIFAAYFAAFSPAYCFPVKDAPVFAARFAAANYPGQAVIADSENGFLFAHGGNPVVLGAFMEDVPDADARFARVYAVLGEGDPAAQLLLEYDAACLFVSPKNRLPSDVNALAQPAFLQDGFALYCRTPPNSP